MFAASKSGSAAAKDPQFNYVTMLLHGNGTNGAQNNTFLDSSTNNFTITRNGNTTQGTFTPYGSNWSNYLASGDSLTLSSSISQGSTWTIEFWYNLNASGNNIVSSQSAGGDYWFGIYASTIYYSYGANTRSFAFTSATNTWYHIALVNNASSLTCYINGTQVGTTQTGPSSSTLNRIGGYQAGYYFAGYISNFRVTNTAVYTSSFTPSTTPLTAISGTQLLTCQSNRFIDNSSSPYTITATSTVSVQRFSPFSPTTAYSTSVIGGSGYFDANGDYLACSQTTPFSFGTGDFCVEAWLYITQNQATNIWYPIFDTRPQTQTNGNYPILGFAENTKYLFAGPSASVTTSSYVAVNGSWMHVAWTRVSSVSRVFVNGVLQLYNGSDSTNYIVGANGIRIGSEAYNSSPNSTWPGYMGDYRVMKGGIPSSYSTSATSVGTSVFTPPTSPETTSSQGASSPSLLLNYTNAGILDNAMMNDLETRGNAQISTSVKKYGTGSMYFDGSGDWLQAPNNAIYNLGGGDFTIEFWLYVAVNPAAAAGLVTKASNAGNTGYTIFYYPTGYVGFGIGSGGLSVQSSASSISTTTWTHVAITRSGTSGKFFINGTQSGSTGTINNFTDSSTVLAIGALDTSTGWNGNYPFNGYIDDLRITKGVARYTANFTPPTAAFPDKG